jgi:exodeoxyribonuclease VII small subunit
MSDERDEGAAGCGAEGDGAANAEGRAAPQGAEGGAAAEGGALSFEESTRRLAKIVAELEGGDLPLERALSLFEEGIRLSRAAQERLDRAEKRVEELLGIDADGRPVTREFEG